MDDHLSPSADPDPSLPGTLPEPVPTRARHDGWTPERQKAFITALAETGCVKEAAAAVGKTPRSAYKLRARADANIFRQAWDIALDYAIRNLYDAALGRVINGVGRPVFYKGEQIGERRYYDERLTQFLLRYRDPVRFGKWRDTYEARRHPDGAAIVLAHALNVLGDVNHGLDAPVDGDGEEAPLDEGPRPEYEIEPDFDALYPDDDPDRRDLRKAFHRMRQPDPADIPDEERDWRDPNTAFRPIEKHKPGWP